jgi:class 3 adenylate cyclase/TolB-like protein/pSer/pThr/pTyr-binding forkhead associated (FHA) protein/Tfp pilus assembly protein PilF
MADESKSLAELLKEWSQLNAELERHQHLVTVMFTDIAGSTRYFDEHGDVAGMAMLTTVNERLGPLVEQYQGIIVKTIGDAIMAYFEDPVAAVRCSMAMQRAIEALNLQRGPGEPVQIRVALNLGVGLLKDNDVFGDVVNVCSRIEHETPAGKIGVSPSVVEALGQQRDIACRSLGAVELRGKVGKLDLYEVLWREEDIAGGAAGPAQMSDEQLAMATGTVFQLGQDVRAAIAEALKGKKAKAALATPAKQFVLVEEKPGGELGRCFELVQGRLLVGREKGDLLFADDSLISSEHALFSSLSGALYVEDMNSRHGVFVRLRQPYDLQDGDTILLGRQVFHFHLTLAGQAELLDSQAKPVLAELVALAGGEEEEERYPLRRGENIIGRVQGDITFPQNNYLSRRHALIKVHGAYAVLQDLKSTNGTFVRIRGKQLLDVDDRVLFGRQVLRVLSEPVSPRAASPQPTAPADPPLVESGPPTLAVLEFENLSNDGGLDWLATGMAETLCADLRKLEQLRVVGRERTQQVLGRLGADATPSDIGRALGARWVVVGSFQGAGGNIRITPRVLEVGSGEVAASCKVDGKWEELFNLQDRVVEELLGALELTLDPGARQRIAAPETQKLEAYEEYSRGRKKFFELSKGALEEARQHLERAIKLDPHYAMAHSALGAAQAMRYVHRTDPDDLAKAQVSLERAVELDAELAEPYPWLCYIYGRKAKHEEAVKAGRKGVALQPDLVQAHYFLGCAYLFVAEPTDEQWKAAVEHLKNAAAVEPRWVTSWLVLSWIALVTGAYDWAERFARRAREQEDKGETLGNFPGAPEMLLGGVCLRRTDWAKAESFYREALERLQKSDRTYREPFMAFSACGLGDLQLRRDDAEAAQASYRRAWRVVQEFPRMLGNERARTRTLAGMAAAYAAQGDSKRAKKQAEEAGELLQQVAREPQTWVWEGSTPQLYHVLAGAWLRLGDRQTSLHLLEQAVKQGWRDAPWLEKDPELSALQEDARLRALLDKLRALSALDFEPAGAAVAAG